MIALAAVCLFAGTAMAVPGVRHAIVNIGSSSSGNTTPAGGTGGANSNGSGQKIPGGSGVTGPRGRGNGNVTVTNPSASTTCSPAVKAPPKAATAPSRLGGTADPGGRAHDARAGGVADARADQHGDDTDSHGIGRPHTHGHHEFRSGHPGDRQ